MVYLVVRVWFVVCLGVVWLGGSLVCGFGGFVVCVWFGCLVEFGWVLLSYGCVLWLRFAFKLCYL